MPLPNQGENEESEATVQTRRASVYAPRCSRFRARLSNDAGLFIPPLGASGAIARVLGAYFLLYPRKSVSVLVGWFGPIRVSEIWVIGGWIAVQLFLDVTREAGGGGGAYWAHVGGALAGVVWVWPFRNRQVVERAQVRAGGGPNRLSNF